MIDYLEGLNDVQRSAVEKIDGPVMVVAGPGSGKTRVLTFRIAHIINSGVLPRKILALTFTNKAAKEMKERIENVVGHEAHRVWAGTFHSIFAKILRFEAEHIGYTNDFTIYDTTDSKNLIKSIVKELNLSKDLYPDGMIYSRISAAKTNLISPKKYAQDANLMEKDRMNRRGEFFKIYSAYVGRCKRAGAMDFDDLLYRTYELFQNNSEILKKYQDKFSHFLVDEFQDTNFLQYAIIRKLVKYPGSAENICIVGDDAQSIYAFRGATIENILDFEKDFQNVSTFKLEQNYRSTSHIVSAANSIITHNKKQIPKKIWTDKETGHKVKIIKALSDNEEGRRVADTIMELKNRHHLDNSEISILYRTNAQSRIFEENLRKFNVPYRVYGGLSFYQRKEIKDMLGYYRLAINPNDDEALKRIINYPKRGIGDTTLSKYMAFAMQNEISLWEALNKVNIGGRTGVQVQRFTQLINKCIEKAKTATAYEAAVYIHNLSGITENLKSENNIESIGRLENIEALINGTQEFTENDEAIAVIEDEGNKSLAAYIQNIALLTDQDQGDDQESTVTLMSVHAAKGLEFDAVLVSGMEENLFPSFMAKESEKDLDEERRLFYVAVTRARMHLYLSLASSRYRYGKLVYNQPSRFLGEIEDQDIDNPEVLQTNSVSSNFENGNEHVFGSKNSKGKTITGFFPKKSTPSFVVPNDFSPSPSSQIVEGAEVLHIKFGKGKVESIDGSNDKKVATIYFDQIDNPRRKLMLKFAKLQVLN